MKTPNDGRIVPVTQPGRRTIPVGASFHIYSWFSDGHIIKTTRTLRIKTADGRGSRIIASEPLGTTFPLTERGAKQADSWTLVRNTAEGDRVGVPS